MSFMISLYLLPQVISLCTPKHFYSPVLLKYSGLPGTGSLFLEDSGNAIREKLISNGILSNKISLIIRLFI